jgi:hypothetical protein
MPSTTTINATYQGRVGKSVTAVLVNWLSQVRNASTGTFVSTYTSNTTVADAIEINYVSGRGGITGICSRVPLFFDVSSVTATDTITSATLKIWNPTANVRPASTIIVKGSAWGGNGSTTTLSTANYNDLDFSTAYSGVDASWGGNTYNDFTMNATALSDMNTNGYLNCFLIEDDYDYDGQNPTLDGENLPLEARVEFLDATNKIKIVLTHAPSGYGNNPLGVTADSVGEILGVAKASVSKFLGV